MAERNVALVTGATGAIGRAVSLSLAEAGFEMWLGCRSREHEAGDLRKNILSLGGHAEVFTCDVTDYESCQSKIGRLTAERGPVSTFVHCAGIVRHLLLLRTMPDDWKAIMATNLGGFYNVSRLVLRGMIQHRRGSIVAIGSVVGHRGLEGHTAYTASKAGLVGAVRSLAREMGSYNIRVNVVSPGWITSGMNIGPPPDRVLQRIPLQRAGNPEDVAPLVRFLCSPAAAYITGAEIPVSGGLDM